MPEANSHFFKLQLYKWNQSIFFAMRFWIPLINDSNFAIWAILQAKTTQMESFLHRKCSTCNLTHNLTVIMWLWKEGQVSQQDVESLWIHASKLAQILNLASFNMGVAPSICAAFIGPWTKARAPRCRCGTVLIHTLVGCKPPGSACGVQREVMFHVVSLFTMLGFYFWCTMFSYEPECSTQTAEVR